MGKWDTWIGCRSQSGMQSWFKSKFNEKCDGFGSGIKKNKEGKDGNNSDLLSPPDPAVRTGLRSFLLAPLPFFFAYENPFIW